MNIEIKFIKNKYIDNIKLNKENIPWEAVSAVLSFFQTKIHCFHRLFIYNNDDLTLNVVHHF